MPSPAPLAFLRRKLRRLRDPAHPVASLLAQAESHTSESHRQRSALHVLMLHLFRTLLDSEAADAYGASSSRILHAAAVAGLPPVLFTLALLGTYSGMSPWGQVRPAALQARDHYMFVAYAFGVGGLAALLKWNAFFPSLLDVRVLGLLPLTPRRLFAARSLASAAFLLLFALGASVPAALIFPGIAGNTGWLPHFAAHWVAVGLAGLAGACFPLVVVALFDAVRWDTVSRFALPFLHSLLLASMVVCVLSAPVVAPLLSQPAAMPAALSFAIPPLWFAGLYEWVLGGARASDYAGLAHRALAASVVAMAGLLLLYPLAYRRRVRTLVEGQYRRAARAAAWTRLPDWLVHRLLPTPAHRAGFTFVAQTLFRVARLRVTLTLAAGAGASLALSFLSLAHPALSPAHVLFATALVLYGLLGGVVLAMASPQETAAAWLFRFLSDPPSREFLRGVRRFIILIAATAGVSLVVGGMALAHASFAASMRGAVAIGLGVLLAVALLFAPLRDVPWTRPVLHQQLSATYLAAVYFLVLPALLWLWWRESIALSEHWPAVGGLAIIVAVVWVAFERAYDLLDLSRYTIEDGEGMQQLHLEAATLLVNRASR